MEPVVGEEYLIGGKYASQNNYTHVVGKKGTFTGLYAKIRLSDGLTNVYRLRVFNVGKVYVVRVYVHLDDLLPINPANNDEALPLLQKGDY